MVFVLGFALMAERLQTRRHVHEEEDDEAEKWGVHVLTPFFCMCQNDQSGLIGRRRVTVYADCRENQLVKMVADEWW